jgi:hypothetical protein
MMGQYDSDSDSTSSLPLAELACIDRTKSAVLNVMVAEGAAIAVSGWGLGRLDHGAVLGNQVLAWRLMMALLFLILLFSRVLLRVGAGRAALRNPRRRSARFLLAHVGSAMIGALAVPLGVVYGWAIEPTLSGIAPFWVVALGVGFLSLPRAVELEGFDHPLPPIHPEPPNPNKPESEAGA